MSSALNLNGAGVLGSNPGQLIPFPSTRTSVLSSPDSQSDTLVATGAMREKRKRMGSRFQTGHLERSGDVIYVRFRVDTEEGRKLVAEKVCPAVGEGRLSLGQQRRKAAEILEMHGINKQTRDILDTTFAEQAERFLEQSQNRRRKPVAASTVATWRSCIDKHLNPQIGSLTLASINNGVAKNLVAHLVGEGLSDKSVVNYFGLVKMVVASAVNGEGEELFPRKWNHEFIELPIVDPNKQNKPTVSSENIDSMLAKSDDEQLKMIVVLAAASGMRIGEILGLSVSNVSKDGTTITITEKAYRGEVQQFLKTKNGQRTVDLAPEVGALLRQYIGNRKGLLFSTRTGQPLSQSNLLKRNLNPLLEELGIAECGFHAFRRYRTTWLRKQRTPEALTQFWLGHAGKSITDSYDRSREDHQYRKEIAALVGTGFSVPSTVVVQKPVESSKIVVAVEEQEPVVTF
jgi:integrase